MKIERAAAGLMAWILITALACSGAGPAPRLEPDAAVLATGVPKTDEAAVAVAAPEEGIRITLLHLNDVYEIGPVAGGSRGGLARVATLASQLRADNPNTLLVHAGDMVSPSAMGTAKVDGVRLAGKQMVAVLNLLGLDLATFGNHEFDLDEAAFRQRLGESAFSWISANVFDARGQAWPGVAPSKIYTFQGDDGKAAKVGFIGVTLEEQGRDYLKIEDPLAAVRRQAEILRPQVDVLIALTHLRLEQDAALAAAVPQLDLILGGHEHENFELRRGTKDIPILKGDANARSVYVIDLRILPRQGDSRPVEIGSRFVPVDASLAEEPGVAREVASWTEKAFAGFRASGFEPDDVVAVSPSSLDGREAVVRNDRTALTDLVAQAMQQEVPGAELAFYNSGSIRIDDVLPPGPISQYDVIRVLPFGGPVEGVRIRGSLLQQVLDQGVKNRGAGGFLQTAGVDRDPDSGAWRVGGAAVDPARDYVAATSDFLLTGREQGLGFLTPENPELDSLGSFRDVRLALIDCLARTFGP
jgi:5'-nucleotidase